MRWILFALALACAPLTLAQTAAQQPAQSGGEQEILRLNDEMSAAMGGGDFRHYDLAAADRLVAPDAVFIGLNGRTFTRAEVFDGMKERVASLKEPPTATSRAEVSNKRAHVFGGTAVVVTDVHFVDQAQGQTSEQDAVSTDVWARRGGRWQLVLANTVSKGPPKQTQTK